MKISLKRSLYYVLLSSNLIFSSTNLLAGKHNTLVNPWTLDLLTVFVTNTPSLRSILDLSLTDTNTYKHIQSFLVKPEFWELYIAHFPEFAKALKPVFSKYKEGVSRVCIQSKVVYDCYYTNIRTYKMRDDFEVIDMYPTQGKYISLYKHLHKHYVEYFDQSLELTKICKDIAPTFFYFQSPDLKHEYVLLFFIADSLGDSLSKSLQGMWFKPSSRDYAPLRKYQSKLKDGIGSLKISEEKGKFYISLLDESGNAIQTLILDLPLLWTKKESNPDNFHLSPFLDENTEEFTDKPKKSFSGHIKSLCQFGKHHKK